MTTIILKNGQPFTGSANLDPRKVAHAYDGGLWSVADLAVYGLAPCVPFVVPDGKVKVGLPRYIDNGDGTWKQEFDVADPDPPSAEAVRLRTFLDEPDVVDLVNRLRTATPDQIAAWIDSNVTNLAAARAVLKAMVKFMVRGA